jgi:hypothetical protein
MELLEPETALRRQTLSPTDDGFRPKSRYSLAVQGGFWATHFPVVFVAALFGVIHLDSGIVVAASAVLLGLIAGELRRMSGSLVPAIVFHGLLNTASALWPAG